MEADKGVLFHTQTMKVTSLVGHKDQVTDVCFGGSGTQLVTGSEDTNVNIYHLDGTLNWSFKKHTHQIYGFATTDERNVTRDTNTSNRNLLAIAAQDTRKIWIISVVPK